ncbi:MAG: hypothetical protein OXN21_06505 [Chloroflexota bacterium]|nr:hypothetical protein [Chloroflexota bacterium]
MENVPNPVPEQGLDPGAPTTAAPVSEALPAPPSSPQSPLAAPAIPTPIAAQKGANDPIESQSPAATARPTPSPTPTITPMPTPTHTPTMGPRQLAALELSDKLPWIATAADGPDRQGADLLIDLWLWNPDFTDRVAGLSWMANGTSPSEARALLHLELLAGSDLGLAETVLTLPWFADGISGEEWRVIDTLSDAAAGDPEIARLAVRIPFPDDNRAHITGDTIAALTILAQQDISLARTATGLPWFAGGISDYEWIVLDAIIEVADVDLGTARLAARIPFSDESGANAARDQILALTALAKQAPDLAKTAAGQPWFADGISDHEQGVVTVLTALAEVDTEVAGLAAGIPISGEDEARIVRETIQDLTLLARQDISLANGIASLLRAGEGVIGSEGEAKRELVKLATVDSALAEVVMGLPWYVSGLQQQSEMELAAVLASLRRIAASGPEPGRLLAGYSWFTGDLNRIEVSFLRELGNRASRDPEAATSLLEFTRSFDRITGDEEKFLDHLWQSLEQDPDFANTIRGMSWLADGISLVEMRALEQWLTVRVADRSVAARFAERSWLVSGPGDYLEDNVLQSLHTLARKGLISHLAGKAWLADGISDEEAALLVPAGAVSARSPELGRDLMQAHYVQKKTVSLPLGGSVRIWVFQNTPFPPGEDLATTIEETILLAEERMQVPFPTPEVILLVLDRSEKSYRMATGYFPGQMRLIRSRGKVYHLPHETAHYYFNRGPSWFREGGAEFVAASYDDWKGNRDLEKSRADAARLANSCIEYDQIENIRHLLYVISSRWELTRPMGCRYTMGETPFHDLQEAMGQEAIWKALGGLHRLNLGPRGDITEENIFRIILEHAPGDAEDDVREIYRTLHGGTRPFPDTRTDDDHGDSADQATGVAMGKPVTGQLDYEFDFDYFHFQAEEGQKYRISVHHNALRPSSLGLYAPDGSTGQNRSWVTRDQTGTGPRIVWIAPSTDRFYFAVHNFGGKTGTYTADVEPVSPESKDIHGDSKQAATRLSAGEVVTGVVDDDLDIDFFRLEVEEGKRYFTKVESGTLYEFLVYAEFPGWATRRWTRTQMTSWVNGGFPWTARESGTLYVGVYGADGATGTYRISISEIAE